MAQSLSRWVFLIRTRSSSDTTGTGPTPGTRTSVRRDQRRPKDGAPLIRPMTSTRSPRVAGAPHRKWQAWPRFRTAADSGGKNTGSAFWARRAPWRRRRLSGETATAKSTSRENSAPPYRMHACPPMSRAFVR